MIKCTQLQMSAAFTKAQKASTKRLRANSKRAERGADVWEATNKNDD